MLLIDAHVHIYDCFDLENFFDSAYENFKTEAGRQGHADNFTGILLLAETSKDNWFKYLCDYSDGKNLPDNKTTGTWKFNHTDEFESLCASSKDKRELFLIAGRQIITAEGLELLALATINSFDDGTSIKQLIELVREKNGIPVIPWGFGKWLGRRGMVLNQLIETAKTPYFFLGDNGNRPFFLTYPAQFKLAQNKNIYTLPGSDPLPLQSEFKKPGSWGVSVSEHLNKSKPAVQLREFFFKKPIEMSIFGEPVGPYGFIKSQLFLHFKRFQ